MVPVLKYSLSLQAIYAYDAQDTDELSFSADDIIEIVKEGKKTILFCLFSKKSFRKSEKKN